MSLEQYKNDMEACCRCSNCKFIPLEKIQGAEHVNVCPSISRYNFHAYSGGGRVAAGIALLRDRIEYTDKMLEVVYNCQTCGACDVSCKYALDMEVIEPIYEIRAKCVENGHTLPALDKLVASLRKGGPMVPGARAKKGEWCKDLYVKDYTKEKVKVIYHAGCLTCADQSLWRSAQAAVNLLRKAGVDVGVARDAEPCCGDRAYQMGYQEDAQNRAKANVEIFNKSGAEILVTGCAECYHAFKVLFAKFDLKSKMKVLHITEYLAQLIKEGKLKPRKEVLAKVTYHDPCYLGRLGEPWIQWEGKQRAKHMRLFTPPRTFRRGANGIYEPPRDILRAIPGVKLVEMDRIKEYAWCCGSGGGVKESNPEFALWTANERIQEAASTGAEILATACPHCIENFQDAIEAGSSPLKVVDVVELLEKSV